LGAAVNVTLMPWVKAALQVVPQVMPAGLLVTVPLPAPVFDTVSVCGDADAEYVTPTVVVVPKLTVAFCEGAFGV
jgi:hypothetical protein